MGIARSRYNLIAPIYDPVMSAVMRANFQKWRTQLWSKVEGQRILEVGVGTGLDFSYYPPGKEITAIDVSRNMLERARKRAEEQKVRVKLKEMDVQHLEFEDNYFHCVVSSLVFCAVDEPLKGLAEVRRVLRPGGKFVLLEHVISDNPTLAWLMRLLNPVPVFLMGEHFTRDTAANVQKSGLLLEKVTHLSGIFRLIEARKPQIYV